MIVSNDSRHLLEGINGIFPQEIMKDEPKYRWNSEFVKLINKRICPYCDNPLTVKGISKSCYCYFYLLGACETLVYERISQNAPVYYGDTLGSEICPECGIKSTKQGFREATSTINAKKEYQKSPTEYKLKTEQKAKKKIQDDAKAKRKKEEKARENEEKRLNRLLFSTRVIDEDLISSIESDMSNLAGHEAGTKWMRVGTLLSFNSTEQMIGAGFKAIIDQNKIKIKQNELILRELKKLNKE